MTPDGFREVPRDSLADTLARRIRGLIQSGEYSEGDRLPAPAIWPGPRNHQ